MIPTDLSFEKIIRADEVERGLEGAHVGVGGSIVGYFRNLGLAGGSDNEEK